MSEKPQLHFLPWIRTGAAAAITAADPLDGVLSANASIAPWLRINEHVVSHDVRVRGPGHVTGIGAQTIVRHEPRPGTRDFEPNYFPFVELRPADLPWRYTPAAAGTQSRLRPWLVLVVVRKQAGVAIGTEPGAPLQVLTIETPARPSLELPDLADSSSWAHVQSRLTAAELPAALEADPTVAVARLICPRRLLEQETWYACLVPAFNVGVHAGLGDDEAAADRAAPAWDISSSDLDDAPLRLPVYHWWSFSTAGDGDFKALARRLKPDDGNTVLGRVGLDITDPGPPLEPRKAGKPVLGDYVGALKSVGVMRRDAPKSHQDSLDRELAPILGDGAQRATVPVAAPAAYLPSKHDPVVAPPLYGSLQTGRFAVPAASDATRAWMRALNLQLPLRAAAGLGAEIVRANQESLVASAWSQAGELRESERALDRAMLTAEVGRSIARRIAKCDEGIVLQVTRHIHPWIARPASAATLAADLRRSAVPRGLVSAPFARASRPRTAIGRAWSRRVPEKTPRPLATASSRFLAATATRLGKLDFAATRLPVGSATRDVSLEAIGSSLINAAPSSPSVTVARAAKTRAPLPVAAKVPVSALTRIAPVVPLEGAAFDGTMQSAIRLEGQVLAALRKPVVRKVAVPLLNVSNAVQAIKAGLDPMPRLASGLAVRIPALSGLLGGGPGVIPRRLALGPEFRDPLSWDLVRLDPRYLVPGAEALADNSVALLEVDKGTVAAVLAGANHEMSRELLWREFPASPATTFFKRFWDTGEGGAADIGDIRTTWTNPILGRNLTGQAAGDLAVIIVRGDLVRRYPDVHIYACRGLWRDDRVVPDPTDVREVVLQGALDARSNFYGFPVSAAALRGNRAAAQPTPDSAGWFIAFEEPPTGPRFGLDAAADDASDLIRGAGAWKHLSWDHLVPSKGSLDDVTHAAANAPLPARSPRTTGGPTWTWGRNSAHMAAITRQKPFRLYIHADRLL